MVDKEGLFLCGSLCISPISRIVFFSFLAVVAVVVAALAGGDVVVVVVVAIVVVASTVPETPIIENGDRTRSDQGCQIRLGSMLNWKVR